MRDYLQECVAQYPEKKSVEVDYSDLQKDKTAIADLLLKNPDAVVRAAESAVEAVAQTLPNPPEKKFTPHVRFYNLPSVRGVEVDVQQLGSEQLNKLARVEGVVNWITEIKPLMKTALWECIHCGSTVKTASEKNVMKQPGLCSCGRKDSFKLVEKSSEFNNLQRGELQDPIEKLRGSTPASDVELWLEDDLVNTITPGERIIATGILRLRPQRDKNGKPSSVYEKFLDVLHIQKSEREFEELTVTKEEEEKIITLSKNPKLFELIIQSIAPSIYGYDELKQAIALQLFGGTPGKVQPDGEKIRSDLHVLLVGDPGTAKSSILEYVNLIAPKSVLVSGGSSSGVGLTAAAERDKEGEGWILKAGALVLANGGIAIIDEFDKMGEEDRGAMHQGMEQQMISIAKAGIVTKFPSRTSVLAAANPKLGRFDPTQPPSQQFDVSPALMSRFDLIFAIRDVLDETRDRKMADHILLGHKVASDKKKAEELPQDSPIKPRIEKEFLQKYIAYSRKTVFPILTDVAGDKIKEFYVDLRRLGAKQNTFPITARQIEGIIRLAEASAKARLSQRVEEEDAERAIKLVRHVLEEVFVDKETGKLDSDVIYVGQPKSKIDEKRNKTRVLTEIVSALEKKFDAVPIDEVVKEAASMGIDEHYAHQLLETLTRDGEFYTPRIGFIKSARKREWG
jgi:replicative DNA helicase Mcm